MKGERVAGGTGIPGNASARSGTHEQEEAAIDPAREAARQAARRAFDARVRGAQVADLVYDSLIDVDEPRAAFEDVRHVRFVAGETGVDLEVSDVQDEVHVAMVVTPSCPSEAEVRAGDDCFVVFVDEDGCAEFDLPRDSLTSVVIPPTPRGGWGIQTAWVRL